MERALAPFENVTYGLPDVGAFEAARIVADRWQLSWPAVRTRTRDDNLVSVCVHDQVGVVGDYDYLTLALRIDEQVVRQIKVRGFGSAEKPYFVCVRLDRLPE